jgi:hypothetical protein
MMKKHLFIAVAVLLAVALSSYTCGSPRSLPGFARPSDVDGFRLLTSGDLPEKEPGRFWLFGGPIGFNEWRRNAVALFGDHGWRTLPAPENPESGYELIAFSPQSDQCISYYDIGVPNDVTRGFRNMVALADPVALEDLQDFTTVLFVAAGKCA